MTFRKSGLALPARGCPSGLQRQPKEPFVLLLVLGVLLAACAPLATPARFPTATAPPQSEGPMLWDEEAERDGP